MNLQRALHSTYGNITAKVLLIGEPNVHSNIKALEVENIAISYLLSHLRKKFWDAENGKVLFGIEVNCHFLPPHYIANRF